MKKKIKTDGLVQNASMCLKNDIIVFLKRFKITEGAMKINEKVFDTRTHLQKL